MKRALAFAGVAAVCGASPPLGADQPAAPPEARLFRVATRVVRPVGGTEGQRGPSIVMSEGWACAGFNSEEGRVRQCWDAGRKPRAWVVPWLKDRIDVARDRVCEREDSGLKFQCWHRPRRGERKPRAMPPRWNWLNPHGATWSDADTRGDRLETVIMGGTFACLRTAKDGGLFCLGDDRFGQLGSSSRPGPTAGADDPAFVRGVFREVTPALGTWHACGLAPHRSVDEQPPIMCWGRGDYGQLGAPAPDRCRVDGQSIPCARRPVAGVRLKDQMAVLGAGDLFTCVTTADGTRCWGANRDGLFGTPGSCPEELRRAWPTLDGPVPAPNASCTSSPVVLPGANEFDPHFSVAPRRICYLSSGVQRCLGGVSKPRDSEITRYWESPGSDASACGLHGDDVFCWGEKYSPPAALNQPVAVAFAPLPPLGDMAVIDRPDAAKQKAGCQIEHACYEPVRKLPACMPGRAPRSVSEVLANASSLAGKTVRVRGPLGVGELSGVRHGALSECDPAARCCGGMSGSVVLGGDTGTLALPAFTCSGDESRVCCNAPAYGQSVVATGRLEREKTSYSGVSKGWRLTNVTVCEERLAQ